MTKKQDQAFEAWRQSRHPWSRGDRPQEQAAWDAATQAERLRCVDIVTDVARAFGNTGAVIETAIVAKIGAKE